METKSISRLLSLLELGGQTVLVRAYPLTKPTATGTLSGEFGWPQGDSAPSPPEASWHADLYMREGELQYCAILSPSGERKLIGEQALNFLGGMGGLSYELLPLPAQASLPPPRTAPTSLPPYPSEVGSYTPPERPVAPRTGGMPWYPSQPGPSVPPWRPTRTRYGEIVVQNPQQLTRDQRRLLALINGQRSVEELSRLLGFSSDALSEVLTFFRKQNLIS